MAGFDIEAFKSELSSKTGPMRVNKFLLTFSSPRIMIDHMNINRNIEYWCQSVNVPGYLIGTHDVRRWTYGPVEKRPWTPNFTQLQCLFVNDNDDNINTFFNTWMSRIIPHNTSRGINTIQQGNTSYAYELEYKQNYATDLNIFIYNELGEVRSNIICTEAHPTQIVDVPLHWGETGIYKFQVNFDFLDWHAV